MSQRKPLAVSKTNNTLMHKALDVRTPIPAYQLKQQQDYLLNKKIRPAIDGLSIFIAKACQLENTVISPDEIKKASLQLEQDILKIETYKESSENKEIPELINEAKHLIQVTNFLVSIQELNILAEKLLSPSNNLNQYKVLPQDLRSMCEKYNSLERKLAEQTPKIASSMDQYSKAKDYPKVNRLQSLEHAYTEFITKFHKVETMYTPFLQPTIEKKQIEEPVKAVHEEKSRTPLQRSHRKRDLFDLEKPEPMSRVLSRSERKQNLLEPEISEVTKQEQEINRPLKRR
jgi:acyl carrier protein phosphodiesterase